MNKAIKSLFQPKAIAIAGASREEKAVGRGIMKNLLFNNYQGLLFPVNPKADRILSMKCYEDVRDIPEQLDLVVIATPRKVVLETMKACVEKNVKAVVVVSAGFKETDEEGEKLEKHITEIARKNKMALVGPNCLGVINTDLDYQMNATFADHHPRKGHISFISQSGAVGVYALEYAKYHHISFAKFASLGNKPLTNEGDLLEAFLEDEQTEVILGYLENLENPQEIFDLAAQNATSGNPKPIIVIKSGRSGSGKRAAESHTGALTESEAFLDDLFLQYGIMRVNDLEELFQSALAFSGQPVPSGKKLCIVTNAGGPGIISSDAAEQAGLEIPELSDELQKALKAELPATASLQNPVDLVGDANAERYEKAIEILIDSDETDMILVLCTPQLVTDMETIARSIGKFTSLVKEKQKLILAAFADFAPDSKVFSILDEYRLPSYRFGINAIKACQSVARFREISSRPNEEVMEFDVDSQKAEEILTKTKNRENNFLTEAESYEVFEAYGFKVAKYKMISGKQDAKNKIEYLQFPVVAKAMSGEIIHKSDIGAVITGIQNESALQEAVETLQEIANEKDADLQGILVQEMLEEGTELIFGVRHEEGYGHLLMFGIGGIFVETLKDVTYRRAPLKPQDARAMVNGINNLELLKGTRGKPAANMEILQEYLMQLSQLVTDFPQIAEIDLNPVFALEDQALLADARIIIRKSE